MELGVNGQLLREMRTDGYGIEGVMNQFYENSERLNEAG